ncbi:xanthine dehydrogenase family protein molybdopterin-binding subunit [Pseudosulfitobacter pseudonitzschiae]|uniref:xanthine dehydrogenase family protein molybdopterin-binding subunit n=1 Tax=Pseudosulfitobacter pseudonitzschiae TaxID=1402135 RepID=UPI001AF0ED67|nr:xanthine dehydrogenase family protein molybdopterin-binding subunit [Pseudosulfitobacter pseudonitzschiae]MBM1817291.1 xanthine dehydrogenase family protein molybdopterin-binding subunit [Pseudosulfitobacter pseudonitzschiae]MBM1834302.1 xanthine dehydrogenase family protein molybdopterin-binding subunit [Pseudosulfitobacter pseudonitzschiae]MBM1839167.1 xanthine dehydrogenase family protein molybdopterin-binding subunit [Pseudosulfitobacter pseudonitzschiae]MBM1844016.1 xanthine dehydrogena
MPKDGGIGAATKRREDVRFLTGTGEYTDDIQIAKQVYAVFARSTVAHGKINGIDTSAAEAMPGVLAVFTGEDFVEVGGNPAGWLINSRDGEPMKEPKRPVLAHGKVRHVGDAYAAVIAETVEQAKDAVEAIEADIEELDAVIDMAAALEGSNFVHDEIGTNQCFDWGWIEDNRAATDDAIKNAHHVTTLELVNNRLVPNAMEPRCSIGNYKASTGEYTLYTTSQNPHLTRLLISAFVLGIPENMLTVIAPDVGGGFGSKIYHYGEEALVLAAAKRLGRPVKWTADRTEAFLTDAHGRDHVTKIELALDADGKFLAFRTDTKANVGAYLSNFATATPTFLHGTLMAGNYAVPLVYVNVKAVFTNTAPVDAYRGAGRPEATYSIERVIDKAARELGLDPIELRRKNFVKPDQYPFTSAAGLEYDSGNYDALMDKMIEVSDMKGFAARRAESEAKGLLRGFGVNAYIEACGIAPSNLVGVLGSRVGLYDAATVRVNATGNLSVMVGAHSHGQGHETAFPQVVAEMLGIDASSINIVHGDTSKIPFGMGTYGSRSLAVCGSAVVRATEKIINKAKKIAGHMLEASDTDIELKDGVFSVAGTDKSVTFGDVALKAYIPHEFPLEDIEPGLEETAFYDPANFTYPSGAYCCEVEVDPATGKVTVERMTAVDDFGNVINPMIVTGQVHGGLAQGIGQALVENTSYDENGQLLSASYMDYAMPRADELPFYTVDHSQGTPCTHNPLGVKGCGEAGAIGSPPTVVNAVIDALQSGGHKITDLDMPVSPSRVWQAMQNAS